MCKFESRVYFFIFRVKLLKDIELLTQMRWSMNDLDYETTALLSYIFVSVVYT